MLEWFIQSYQNGPALIVVKGKIDILDSDLVWQMDNTF
jgi:hypothetical protein